MNKKALCGSQVIPPKARVDDWMAMLYQEAKFQGFEVSMFQGLEGLKAENLETLKP
jgi:hypothetical protein